MGFSFLSLSTVTLSSVTHISFNLLTFLHVLAGAFSLIAFWLPVLARKGSRFHVQSGKVFVILMYIVSITGLLMSLLVLSDPIAVRQPEPMTDKALARFLMINQTIALFLMMLSLLVLTNVRQSVLVLKAKSDRRILRKPSELALIIALGVAGVYVGYLGVTGNQVLFMIFASVSIFNCLSMLRYIFKSTLKTKEWLFAHFGNIIGAGIGAYTAFFAFGGREYLSEILTGHWQLLPWVTPATIGTLATMILNRRYSRRFQSKNVQPAG